MKRLSFWLGLLIGLAAVIYIISTIKNPAEFGAAFRQVNPLYLLPLVASYFLIIFLRSLRWRFILNHIGRTGVGEVFAAMLICYMGNNLFPFRAGELMRVFLLGRRRQGISYSGALATVVVERLFDFLVVLLSLAVVLLIIPFPQDGLPLQVGNHEYDLVTVIRSAGMGALLAVVVLLSFLLLLTIRTAAILHLADRLFSVLVNAGERVGEKSFLGPVLQDRPRKWQTAALATLERFAAGLRILGQPGAVLILFGWTVLIWAVNLAPVWLSGLAFAEIGSIDLRGCAFLLIVGAAATSIPGPPGFFGIFHAFNQIGLLFYLNDLAGRTVAPETALSFAIILHAGYYFPITAAGIIAAWVEGYSLARLRVEAEKKAASQQNLSG